MRLAAAFTLVLCLSFSSSALAHDYPGSHDFGLDYQRSALYALGGYKWPSRTISYWDGIPGLNYEMNQAIAAWNRSGVKLRLKKASKAKAKLKLIMVPKKYDNGTSYGTIGWVPSNGYATPPYPGKNLKNNWVWISRSVKQDRAYAIRIFAHEIGHNLGLKHSGVPCATMSYKWDKCPQPKEAWKAYCRVLEADDIKAVVKRYGGQVKLDKEAYCERSPAPQAVTGLTGELLPTGQVKLNWIKEENLSYKVTGSYNSTSCAGSFADNTTEGSITDDYSFTTPVAGTACYQVVATDGYGREAAPVSVQVVITTEAIVKVLGYDPSQSTPEDPYNF